MTIFRPDKFLGRFQVVNLHFRSCLLKKTLYNGYREKHIFLYKMLLKPTIGILWIHQLEKKNYLSTPYIKGASEKVEKLLKPFNLKLSNKSSNTLRTQLCKLKDKKKIKESSNVVY